ncbi:MAG: rod shape-determining protein MreC [Ignavibacteriales bacterium CG18_big_fil_WC_8_21_14_2_50_31_20]|nr:MAG: rod shape-determining protein MreC [Ignavibacteriales bacterium CG18_big_fil_WC_8_21_14_2_50_31_20]
MELFVRKIFKKSKEYILLFILLIISLIILTQSTRPEIKKIRRYAFASFAVWADLFNSTFSSENTELNKLQIENAKLMLQVNKLREYAFENYELKSLLKFKAKSDYNLIPTTIIAKNISKSQGVYIINIGSKDSVRKSMPILNESGLVGIVIETSENYSLVKSIESSTLKISANIPRSNVYGIISWSGDMLVMHNVPTTADINKGDRVVTSVLSTIFPPSIPIGLVVERRSNISGLLSDIFVQPFANVNSAKNVFVLASVKSSQIDSLELNLLSQ